MVSARSEISQTAVTVPVKVDWSEDSADAWADDVAAMPAKAASQSCFPTVGKPAIYLL